MGKITYDWTAKITGSAYSDATANKITAPHGKVIIAIQAVGVTTSSNVLVELVAEDSSLFANSVAAAHIGTTSDAVNHGASETIAAGTAITMTSDVGDTIAVGWYADGVGIPYGTKVTDINIGDDAKEIKLDDAFVCTDGQTVYFTNPNDKVHGTGGRNVTTGTNMALVSEGHTIFGRWHTVRPADGDGNGIIAYFGE